MQASPTNKSEQSLTEAAKLCGRLNDILYAELILRDTKVFSVPVYCYLRQQVKSEAIPVTGRGGLYGCKMLRNQHCLDNRLTDGGKVVSSTHRPLLYSPETLFFGNK
jgi:hypothetical protein